MFCLKCGEAIPDNSVTCPICGAMINEETSNEKAVIYASQKKVEENNATITESVPKKKFYIWCTFAILSFIFLGLNYLKVSISFYYVGSSVTSYSGYGLLGCLKGSVAASGYMVILLIIINIAVIITGIIGVQGGVSKKNILKNVMIIESVAYLIAAIVPYFDIKKVLEEFDSDISTTSIGVGCYLNIVLAIVVFIYFFVSVYKQLKDE